MSDKSRYEAKTDSEWLANIYEMLAESDDLSFDEVKEGLKEEGEDPEALIKRGMAFIERERQLATKRMLEEAKKKGTGILKDVEPSLDENLTFEGLREKVKEAWTNLTELPGPKLQLAYRNLENLTKQDLYSLLGDLERLAQLSEEEGNGRTGA